MFDRLSTVIIAGLLLTGLTTTIHAQQDKVKLKLSPERIVTPLPEGWKIAYHVRDGRKEVQEYVPDGETVERWNFMVTTKIYDRLTRGPHDYNRHTIDRFASLCSKSTKIIGETEDRHGYESSLAFIECLTTPAVRKKNKFVRKREFRVQLAIKGKDALYVAESAWHTDDLSLPPPTEDANLLNTITGRLDQVFVCDNREKDKKCADRRASILGK